MTALGWLAVVAALLAACAALVLAVVAWVQQGTNRRQAAALTETLREGQRPVIVPDGELALLNAASVAGAFEGVLDMPLRNVGAGVALNVRGRMYARGETPASLARYVVASSQPLERSTGVHAIARPAGDIADAPSDIRVAGIELYPPSKALKDEASQGMPIATANARLILTYQDVFGLPHASVFDLTTSGTWECRGVFRNVRVDLDRFDREESTTMSLPTRRTAPPAAAAYVPNEADAQAALK